VNPNRLAELQRQRDLVRDHLNWLDKEIASELGPASLPALTVIPAIEASVTPQPDPIGAATSARRGCFLFFSIGIALFMLALVAIYFLKYRDRPLIFVEDPAQRAAPATPSK
jgi:hypothetical protein